MIQVADKSATVATEVDDQVLCRSCIGQELFNHRTVIATGKRPELEQRGFLIHPLKAWAAVCTELPAQNHAIALLAGARSEDCEEGCLINLSAGDCRCLDAFDFGDDVADFQSKFCRWAIGNNGRNGESTGFRESGKSEAKLGTGTALLGGLWREQADM